MIESIYQETRDSMKKSIDALKNEFKKVRTGRASLSILDDIRVDYYGALTPLNQMASLSIPESRMIAIQPWDVSVIKDVEQLVKTIYKKSEEYKVSIRNVRRDANDLLKSLKKDGEISEDDAFKGQDRIQEITDEYINIVDDVCKEKEKEILEF